VSASTRRRIAAVLALALAGSIAAGCDADRRLAPVRAALATALGGARAGWASADEWAETRRFYDAREGRPAWVTANAPTKLAKAAVALLAKTTAHGLSPDAYGEPSLRAELDALGDLDDEKEKPNRLATFDAGLTAAMLAAGHDVALGRIAPSALDRRWKNQRTAPPFAATLQQTLDAGRIDGWLDALRPPHPAYAALQQALAAGDAHADQIALNMERWRWMPDDLGPRHFFVNIPAFELHAREQGQDVLAIDVVVGKPETSTPVFSSTMTTVVFSPYWNIPESIVDGETAPAAARDSAYLAKNHIEILRVTKSGATAVDPSRIDWDDAEQIKDLAFRQRPGPSNALGLVKFLFPNDFDVYLHDTPADALFKKPSRAFSHGCVRVEDPEGLARYVLRGDPDWDDAKIAAAMRAGVEKQVKLKEPIPVHIAYFTAWIGPDGAIRYAPDIYGYDAKQQRAILEKSRR
jgi:murein L,D-transpeptidase YcbB/YkuD